MSKKEKAIIAYKGFDLDLKCRDFQYEIGGTYEQEGNVYACNSGFHACEYPLDVFRYYAPSESRFALVEQSGATSTDGIDSKIASQKISIKSELSLAELINAAIEYTFSHSTPEGETATGWQGAAMATGRQGAASSTGEQGAAIATGAGGAASSTGYKGAASATGWNGRAMAAEGCAIFLAERDDGGNILSVWAGIAGKDRVKPNVWYTLKSGKPKEIAK